MKKYTGNSKWSKSKDSPMHQEDPNWKPGNNQPIPTEKNSKGESQNDIFLKRRNAVNAAKKGLKGFIDRMEDANRDTPEEIDAIGKEKSLYKKILRKAEDKFDHSNDSIDKVNLIPLKIKNK